MLGAGQPPELGAPDSMRRHRRLAPYRSQARYDRCGLDHRRIGRKVAVRPGLLWAANEDAQSYTDTCPQPTGRHRGRCEPSPVGTSDLRMRRSRFSHRLLRITFQSKTDAVVDEQIMLHEIAERFTGEGVLGGKCSNVPSPPGLGEKVAEGRMRGLIILQRFAAKAACPLITGPLFRRGGRARTVRYLQTTTHPDTPSLNTRTYSVRIVQSCEIVFPEVPPRRPADSTASSDVVDRAERNEDCGGCTDLPAHNATADNCSVRRTSCPRHLDCDQTATDHFEDQSDPRRVEYESHDFQLANFWFVTCDRI